MIRINVLGTLQTEVAQALKDFRARSFSERNKHLGKMINCNHPSCTQHRHRASVKHEDLVYSTPHYDLDEETGLQKSEDEKRILIAPATRNGIVGAARFAKQRFHPHRHPRTLEAKQCADELFAEDVAFAESVEKDTPLLAFQPDITACVRESIKTINDRLILKRKRARMQTQLSRRINRGLATPGARI